MFVNGTETVEGYGQTFTSKELQHCPADLMQQASELKEVFPGAEVIKGSVHRMEWNTPDDLDAITKPDTKRDRVKRSAIAQSLRNLEKLAS